MGEQQRINTVRGQGADAEPQRAGLEPHGAPAAAHEELVQPNLRRPEGRFSRSDFEALYQCLEKMEKLGGSLEARLYHFCIHGMCEPLPAPVESIPADAVAVLQELKLKLFAEFWQNCLSALPMKALAAPAAPLTYLGQHQLLKRHNDRAAFVPCGLEAVRANSLPETGEKLLGLLSDNPALNEISPLSYQELPGRVRQGALWFRYPCLDPLRTEKEPEFVPTHRLYLNPHLERLPNAMEFLTGLARTLDNQLTVKCPDFSLPDLPPVTHWRRDRIVVYVGAAQVDAAIDAIHDFASRDPSAFAGRPLPPFVAEVSTGIGLAREPDAGGGSFLDVRAGLLRHSFQETARLLAARDPEAITPHGCTRRALLERAYCEALYEEDRVDPAAAAADIIRGGDAENDPDLTNVMLSRAAIGIVRSASPDEGWAVLETLMPKLAPEHHVRPDNLAESG